MTTFYIALPWIALVIAACVELHDQHNSSVAATPILVLAVLVLLLVMLGAMLGGSA